MPETNPIRSLEAERYGRHMVLPQVGPRGQERLRNASVAVVGAGGLGSPLTLYLAAAGVGRIGLIDDDVVDLTNLQRQVLFGTTDVGVPKVRAAARRLSDVNPHVRVELHRVRLDAGNAGELLGGYDVVADGSDNFATRYVVNDTCVLLGKANVYGSVFRFEGQASVFADEGGPCYRCLYPDPPEPGAVPSCAEGGVLGVLPGIIGSIQAAEVLKRILGAGDSLAGRLLLFDALEMRFRELRVARDPACPVCGEAPTIRTPEDVRRACTPAAVVAPAAAEEEHAISPRALHERMLAGETIQILDVRMPVEWQICRIEGAIPIPMHEIASRVQELDRHRETVVYCHVGVRSALVTRWLRDQGFATVRNLTGGIDAWSREVDPAVPRY